MAAVQDPEQHEQQLAWEARQRPRAGVAAILAGLLTLAGAIISPIVLADAPQSRLLDGVGRALEPGPVGGAPSGRTGWFEHYAEQSSALLGAAVLRGIGLFALAWAVTFLAAATRARRREFAKPAVYVVLVGAVLSGLAAILGQIAVDGAISTFLDGPRTVDTAREIGSGTLLTTSQFIGLAGQLALASGLVLVALNAMRAGLLTRFLGILGMITGALVIIPIGPLPVVQTFWLLALGLLFLGIGRGGMPPAWRTGKAEPWPTSAELAEARRAQQESRGRGRRAPEPRAEEADEPVTAGYAHPASKKRKRKRRG